MENKSDSLLNERIVDISKFKTFTRDKFTVAKMMEYFFEKEENIVGKGENADYQNFLLFPTIFSSELFLMVAW